jgi:hypothetical protein
MQVRIPSFLLFKMNTHVACDNLVAAHDGRAGDFNHHYAHHLKGIDI